MLAQAIKLDNGWLIKDLPGFDNIKRDVINVDVQLYLADNRDLDYKELKGVAIMERYFEKQQREEIVPRNNSELHSQFRQVFGIQNTRLSDAIKDL